MQKTRYIVPFLWIALAVPFSISFVMAEAIPLDMLKAGVIVLMAFFCHMMSGVITDDVFRFR
ncbi:MAG: hypothetical protein RLY31_2380 [Bacteroidota bacterium]